MPTRNDVTGDSIQSKNNSDSYRNNWDSIFAGIKNEKTVGVADVTQGADHIRNLSVVGFRDDAADEKFYQVMGFTPNNIGHSDELFIYELISMIICINGVLNENDLRLLSSIRELAKHTMIAEEFDQFDKFYSQWVKDHADEKTNA